MKKIVELRKVREILSKTDYKTLSDILDSYVPSVPISIYGFDNKPFALSQLQNGGLNLLYRGRLLTDNENKPFKEFKEINYISKEDVSKIRKFGRVNRPFESMFYASTEMAVACLETFSKGVKLEELEGNKSFFVQLGVWKINSPMKLARMISPERYFNDFIENEEIKKMNLKKITLEIVKSQNEKLKSTLSTEEEFEILEFFSQEFAKTNTQDHNEYKISNYYADRVFNRNINFYLKEDIDGILYPSVPSCYQELNLALPPVVVDNKLKFLWCDLIWVVLSKKDGAQFIPIGNRIKLDETGLLK
jgi:RES domain